MLPFRAFVRASYHPAPEKVSGGHGGNERHRQTEQNEWQHSGSAWVPAPRCVPVTAAAAKEKEEIGET